MGVWARHERLDEAVRLAMSHGAGRNDKATVELYVHPTEDPKPAVINGGMNVQYREGTTKIHVITGIRLGALLLNK